MTILRRPTVPFDERCYQEVLVKNQYRLVDAFPKDFTVLDIGAYIGCFTCACLDRAAYVDAFEPDYQNFMMLQSNISNHPLHSRASVANTAMWRSDVPSEMMPMRTWNERKGNTFAEEGTLVEDKWPEDRTDTGEPIKVQTTPLDAILSFRHHVDLLKLDCEGSEFPILYTSHSLGRVRQIIMEVHDWLKFNEASKVEGAFKNTREDMCKFLVSQGFIVDIPPGKDYPFIFCARPGVERAYKV